MWQRCGAFDDFSIDCDGFRFAVFCFVLLLPSIVAVVVDFSKYKLHEFEW